MDNLKVNWTYDWQQQELLGTTDLPCGITLTAVEYIHLNNDTEVGALFALAKMAVVENLERQAELLAYARADAANIRITRSS